MTVTGTNPILPLDFPDVDVIRVEDTYYMVSTTMYFMPGCVILRSFDLIHWEYCARVYDILEDTPRQRLEGEKNAYGCGMWAPSFRYHKGVFHICFVANDTHKTYLYRAKNIQGPWGKREIQGFYHDPSLFFDEDDRAYIIYGGGKIYLTELEGDLSRPRENGLHRLLIDSGKNGGQLGYEGSHFYKINGKYYLFVIHSLAEEWFRAESCFTAEKLTDPFQGGIVFQDDMGFFHQGVAQGGIVDDGRGNWYALLFQDRGAAGRMPVLLPMAWENDFPVLGMGGKAPREISLPCAHPDHAYAPLYGSDDFSSPALSPYWEWNHIPDPQCWRTGNGRLILTAGKTAPCLTQARNILTQRALFPGCSAIVTLDGSAMRPGDRAGICVLQSQWGLIGLEKTETGWRLIHQTRKKGDAPTGGVLTALPWNGPEITLKITLDFDSLRDEALFHYWKDGSWHTLGGTHKMRFTLDHFTGNRFGLFLHALQEKGGSAAFSRFIYQA